MITECEASINDDVHVSARTAIGDGQRMTIRHPHPASMYVANRPECLDGCIHLISGDDNVDIDYWFRSETGHR